MKRYMRTFRRHRLLVIAPIVLALVVGLGYELKSPHQYQAQGTLWADAPVPNGSTVFTQNPPSETPASQAASTLNELMATNQFLTKVGSHSPWAAYLKKHPNAVDTLFASLKKDTTVAQLGPQVLSVTYQGTDGATAESMVKAIMNGFVSDVVSLERARDQQQISYDNQTLQTASKALNSAQQQLSTYLSTHPQQAGATVDPTVTQLSGNVATAQQAYGAAVSSLNGSQLGLSSAADSSQLHVIDEPLTAYVQASKKKVIYAGIGGLFAGGVISILLLSWLVSKDTSPLDAEDLEDELGLTVVGTIEELPSPQRKELGVS